MTTKTPKKETKQQNKSGAEKPVSLWGASFQDILKALLETRPMSKKDSKKSKTKQSS